MGTHSASCFHTSDAAQFSRRIDAGREETAGHLLSDVGQVCEERALLCRLVFRPHDWSTQHTMRELR